LMTSSRVTSPLVLMTAVFPGAVGDLELAGGHARAAVECGQRGGFGGFPAAEFECESARSDGGGVGISKSLADGLLSGDQSLDLELIAADGGGGSGGGGQDVGVAAVGAGRRANV